jgi:hypothetical protein
MVWQVWLRTRGDRREQLSCLFRLLTLHCRAQHRRVKAGVIATSPS